MLVGDEHIDGPTITYPNGGESIIGNTLSITFKSPNNILRNSSHISTLESDPNVYVLAYKKTIWYELFFTDDYDADSKTNWIHIATVPAGTEQFNWKIPFSIRGNRCKLGIRSKDVNGVRSDISESAAVFSIKEKKIQSPSVLSPTPGLPYRSFVPIVLNHEAILNTPYQRSFYNIYYRSQTYGIDWTVIQENVVAGSHPLQWDIRDLKPGSYSIKVTLQDDYGNSSIPVIIDDISVYPLDYLIIDTTPPRGRISIKNNQEYTKDRGIVLEISAFDEATEVKSVVIQERPEGGESKSSTEEHMSNIKTWQILSEEDGLQFIEAQFKDYANNEIAENEGFLAFRTYLSDNNKEITAFIARRIDNTDVIYTAIGGDNPSVWKDQNRITQFDYEVSSLEIFDNTLYLGTITENGYGVLGKIQDNVFTEIIEFEEVDSRIESLRSYDDVLYIGLRSGQLYSFDGSTVSLVIDFDKRIANLESNGNVLFICLENEQTARVYNGTDFLETEWTNGNIQI